MAEKRRLQGEIDRTLKKVNEGRTLFKETLEKFESSNNHAQKEKHEADLKKEIKKLQRFRDNIKTWLASPDVKDKTQLIDMRKLIEYDMERFKVIEKETKTKAYSKEGLYIETKKDPMQKEKEDHLEWLKLQISKLSKNIEVCDFDILKLMPIKKKRNAEKDKLSDLTQKLGMFKSHLSKQETLMRLLDNDKIELDKVKDFRYSFEEFINNPDSELYKSDQGLFIYDDLNLDELSADISMAADLDSSAGKLDLSVLSNVPAGSIVGGDTSLGYIVSQSSSYFDKKENAMEMLPEINPVVLDDVNSSQKPQIDKTPKEKLVPKLIKPPVVSVPVISSSKQNLESLLTLTSDNGGKALKSPSSITVTSTPIKNCCISQLDGSDYLSIHNVSDSSIKEPSLSSLDTTTAASPSLNLLASCQQTVIANTPPEFETVSNIIDPPSSSIMKESYVIADQVIKSTVGLSDGTAVGPGIGGVGTGGTGGFSVVSSSPGNYITFSANHEPILKSVPINKPSKIVESTNLNQLSSAPLVQNMLDMIGPSQGGGLQQPPQQQSSTSVAAAVASSSVPASYFELQQQQQQNNLMIPSQNDTISHQYVSHRSSISNMLVDHAAAAAAGIPPLLSTPNTNPSINTKDNTIDMILEPGDAMSPFRNHQFQNNDYYNNQISAMEHGRMKLPLTSDSEKARLIIYKNETQIPDYFPKDPIPGSDTEEYYMRLDSETLFFIFYYFEGTKAQYLAAKALKRMSWRFHTGHMCWFQRHEEPKQITDNSESGTYIFYDFESMSRQKKENFTFSYNYLEDKDF